MDILPVAMSSGGLAPVVPVGAEAAFAVILGEALIQSAAETADPTVPRPRAETVAAEAPAPPLLPSPLSALPPAECQTVVMPQLTTPPIPPPVEPLVPPPDTTALAEVELLVAETMPVSPPRSRPRSLPRVARVEIRGHDAHGADPAPRCPEISELVTGVVAVPLPGPLRTEPVGRPVNTAPAAAPVAATVNGPAASATAALVPADTSPAIAQAALPTNSADALEPRLPQWEVASTVGNMAPQDASVSLTYPLSEATVLPGLRHLASGRVEDVARQASLPSHHRVEAAVTAALHHGTATAQTIIRLNPTELGAVQIKVDRPKDGGAAVTLTVERPETLLMLLRDRDGLVQALDRAGVPAESRVVTYQVVTPGNPIHLPSGDAGADQGQSRHDGFGQSPGSHDRHAAPERIPLLAAESEAEHVWTACTDRVDITA